MDMGYDEKNLLMRMLLELNKINAIFVFFCFVINENYHQYFFSYKYTYFKKHQNRKTSEVERGNYTSFIIAVV